MWPVATARARVSCVATHPSGVVNLYDSQLCVPLACQVPKPPGFEIINVELEEPAVAAGCVPPVAVASLYRFHLDVQRWLTVKCTPTCAGPDPRTSERSYGCRSYP